MSRFASLTVMVVCASFVISSGWLFSVPSNLLQERGNFNNSQALTTSKCESCSQPPNAILFTGDLMLARHVERLAIKNGDRYSFTGLSSIVKNTDSVVTNFEASIPTPHIPTPDFTMRFSVPYRLAALLPEYNIFSVSLANNHTDDFGEVMYQNTKKLLNQAGVNTFGHPNQVTSESISYIKLADVTVAVIGIHTLYRKPTAAELTKVFAEAASKSDWQVAYVHWGDEYQPIHNSMQSSFAAALVTAGADVIVGHHPHVVQDIAIIDGVPVFYSLGNFVFDQYFSPAVQEGLVVRMHFTKQGIDYQLIPITSKYSVAQPHLMPKTEAVRFLADLRDRSQLSLGEQVALGLRAPIGLATSTQISIMTE